MNPEVKEWISPFIVEKKWFHYANDTYQYFVVLDEMLECEGEPSQFVTIKDGVLLSSQSYPELYRKFGLIHELVTQETPLRGLSCVNGLLVELRLVRERKYISYKKYLEFRHKYFLTLVKHYVGRERSEAEEQLLKSLHYGCDYLKERLFLLSVK